MSLQITTAISDVPVALSAAYAAWSLRKTSAFASFAFSGVLTAAALGVIRFGFDPSFRPSHEFVSAFSTQVLMATVFLSFSNIPKNGKPGARRSAVLPYGTSFSWLIFALLTAAFAFFRYVVPSPLYAEVAPIVCFMPVAYVALTRREPFTVVGALLYLLIGVVITDKGVNPYLGVLNLDLFHYVLTVAQVAFAHALLRLLR
eukprot:TRINITY_DN19643_c0_g1_i1.p1 TRINITY_DN19643_c0_g1~~TRINITY_DN19643_c0_g1_i1.p1  ORF type:complete len:202 (-),score=19.11 TRINITY_DN19643_c0_g1_i1:15-620(-)